MDRNPGTCENCDRPDDELVRVHRIYLLPEMTRVEEVEWWCVSCRSQYPCEEIGAIPES